MNNCKNNEGKVYTSTYAPRVYPDRSPSVQSVEGPRRTRDVPHRECTPVLGSLSSKDEPTGGLRSSHGLSDPRSPDERVRGGRQGLCPLSLVPRLLPGQGDGRGEVEVRVGDGQDSGGLVGCRVSHSSRWTSVPVSTREPVSGIEDERSPVPTWGTVYRSVGSVDGRGRVAHGEPGAPTSPTYSPTGTVGSPRKWTVTGLPIEL